MFKRVVLPLLVLALLVAAYFWAALSWSYSTGDRAGWVQKLSNKGWVCKTWEGELALVSLPGTTPEKFTFTIWDEAVARQVSSVMGKRVSLHYAEKVGCPAAVSATRVTTSPASPSAKRSRWPPGWWCPATRPAQRRRHRHPETRLQRHKAGGARGPRRSWCGRLQAEYHTTFLRMPTHLS